MYCVGPVPWERWRSFLQVDTVWHPKDAHDRFLRRRDFAARNVYELTVLLDVCPDFYVCVETLKNLRVAARAELRVAEIDLASFQLTTQQTGLRLADREALFESALYVWSAHLFLFDTVARVNSVKTGRKAALALRPYRSDGARTLADRLDKNLHALHVLLGHGFPLCRRLLPDPEVPVWVELLCRRLDLAVKGLDRVVLVTDDCDR